MYTIAKFLKLHQFPMFEVSEEIRIWSLGRALMQNLLLTVMSVLLLTVWITEKYTKLTFNAFQLTVNRYLLTVNRQQLTVN